MKLGPFAFGLSTRSGFYLLLLGESPAGLQDLALSLVIVGGMARGTQRDSLHQSAVNRLVEFGPSII